MDTRIGLDYVVENSEYVVKLGTALDTKNTAIKKQVFELLSALCAYSEDGYERALQTLQHFKVICLTCFPLVFDLKSLFKSTFQINTSDFGKGYSLSGIFLGSSFVYS